MGLLARLINLEQPNVAIHSWMPLFEQFKRERVSVIDMLDAFALSDKSQDVASVFTGTDKLGIAVSHTWADTDVVGFTTTGGLPAPLSLGNLYYIVNSNPTEGTVKVSLTSGGAAVDLTTAGTGTHTMHRADDDVGYWNDTRLDVTSSAGNADQKLRRVIWDLKAEGLTIIGANGIDHTSVVDLKAELEELASWLTVA